MEVLELVAHGPMDDIRQAAYAASCEQPYQPRALFDDPRGQHVQAKIEKVKIEAARMLMGAENKKIVEYMKLKREDSYKGPNEWFRMSSTSCLLNANRCT